MSDLAQFISDWQPLLATLVGVAGLLFLIIVRRVNAFAALLVGALATGLMAGLSPPSVIDAVTNGFAGVLGFIAVIVGLGALLGVYLEASGGASALARSIIGNRPAGPAGIAMGFVGLIIAIPVFFDVGLILLFPLVQALSKRAGKPALYFGLPLLAGLATAHAFIPPTPGPVAVAEILSAQLGLVIICGLIAGIPAMLVAGPYYARLAEGRGWLETNAGSSAALVSEDTPQPDALQSLALRAMAVLALPLALIVLAAFAPMLGWQSEIVAFIGHPFVALMIGCALAAWILRGDSEEDREKLRDGLTRAFEPTAVILLVTGAGGAFKQVLVDTGAGKLLAESFLGAGITPIIAGFLLAAIVRVAQGSATVAMLTAAGLSAPIAAAAGLEGWDLARMVIAIAAGASIVSHVNDSGFWLVSRYFGLDAKQTLRTWTVASTLVGCVGFAVVLALGLVL
ncbi:gluconate:H+ symporter [Erythrobacter sp. F6033]|uniref:GntP family permease n=1 Tax=Erythrobacter sp. F6033 TaxID=2926401 RepID=UPI001FF2A586|nr:GntP family permease [Erythrobacter sp. F6033]